MSLTSWTFALFVAVVLAVDLILRGPARKWWGSMGGLRPAVENLWLLAASIFFYVGLGWSLALVMVAMTAVNFFLARRIETRRGKHTGLLSAGIALNIAALAWFKYTDFFVEPAAQALARVGIHIAPELIAIGLPVGLSYLVLQMISYLVDVSRGQLQAERSPIDFGLYALYFPKVTAGPIERARSFLPMLKERPPLDGDALGRAVGLIAMGLFRKLFIANTLLRMLPDQVFNKPTGQGAPVLVATLIAYGVYLLNDFAGYTSIVRGVSLLLGIELSPNFLTPYFSRSFVEFWNQWHVSLSHWLRDYIYFPVSRALLRRNPDPRWLPNSVVAPMLTMLASGLWHGASPGLIVWGAVHGLYQAVERLAAMGRPAIPANRLPIWRQALAMLVVFILAIAAWIPFRVPWGSIGPFLTELLNWSKPPGFIAWRVLIIIIPALLLDAVVARSKDEQFYLRWPSIAQAFALAAALLLVGMSSMERISTFVYQAF